MKILTGLRFSHVLELLVMSLKESTKIDQSSPWSLAIFELCTFTSMF